MQNESVKWGKVIIVVFLRVILEMIFFAMKSKRYKISR